MNNSFVKDTILIDEKLNITVETLKKEMLQAVFLPYYTDPESLELKIVLKRSILPGCYHTTGRKLGLSALTVELPADNPLTIEQAFEKLNLDTKIENAVPFGSVMPLPQTSTLMYEMVLVNIEPLNLIDEERGIYYQEKGKFEIGVADFKDLISGIQSNIVQDLKTRMMLNELYLLAVEESARNNESNQMMSGNKDLIGGGSNLPDGYGEQTDTMKTSNIPDEVMKQNSQMDYGSIYSGTSSKGDFKTIVTDTNS